MKYRAEVDGLRAVAILPVIFFHAGFKIFEGGFVGVDVFFVVSGYLITTIILSDMNKNKFSIVTFYERRARRIMPALFFVMFCCLPFAYMWLMPIHLKDFSQSLTAVTVFSSNILFWIESGYFGVESELKPLLHTWSLAVEEQYYVLFPLFLMVLWRLRKRWIFGALIIVGIASLALAQWGAYNKPIETFFLLPARAWELAIGALIAFYFLYQRDHAELIKNHKKTSEVFSILGLLLIFYSIFAFDNNTPFPSFYALLPTIGTGLIIVFATSETAVGRLLSTKVMVSIGLLSYSTYLWHQPLFVFARHRSMEEPSTALLLTLSASSILLAYISWRYVESPFRNKKLISRKSVFAFAIFGSVFFAFAGIVGHFENGFDGRKNDNGLLLTDIPQKTKINHGLSKECEGDLNLSNKCRTSDNPEILLWGDSYAMHLAQGIMSSKPDVKMIQMTKSVCGPFFNAAPVTKKYPESWAKGCLEFNKHVYDWLSENKSIKYAVLASPFGQYLNDEILVENTLKTSNSDIAKNQLLSTLNKLEDMGIKPVIFAPPPKNGTNIGECLVRHEQYNIDTSQCNFDRSKIEKNSLEVYKFLSDIPQKYKVISLQDMLCKDSTCKTVINDTFVYRDGGHLSKEGSALLGKRYDFYELITK